LTMNERQRTAQVEQIVKQIELDINRTMPGNKLFDDSAEGGIKMKRILCAYSIHVNPTIGYCQGFNFIVAVLLSVHRGDEHRSLLGLIWILEHVFPSANYFDNYLTGARADQQLLADLIEEHILRNSRRNRCTSNDNNNQASTMKHNSSFDQTITNNHTNSVSADRERKIIEAITSTITLNWFISLFHGALPAQTRLVVLDNFMISGVKSLFRFTLAIIWLALRSSLSSSSSAAVAALAKKTKTPCTCGSSSTSGGGSCDADAFNAIRTTARQLYDVSRLLRVAARVRLPKDSYFTMRRSFYITLLSAQQQQYQAPAGAQALAHQSESTVDEEQQSSGA
ncbi:TBC1 domain family member 2A, partial [Fragariocoptes setiger]